jgi:hypothetical protein
MQAYAAAVREPTSRDFTFKSDVLNAFAGISSFMRPFFRGRFGFGFGLLETEFDLALLWEPIGNSTQIVDSTTG